MNLHFDLAVLPATYKSNSQKARVLTESWVGTNMFCPFCGHSKLTHTRNNFPVGDFICEQCNEFFELKSQSHQLGKVINDGAYSTMIERITSNQNPSLFTMHYHENQVIDFVVVPKFFFTPSVILKRNPLASTARRAGWIGCNILYRDIPPQGKISIVKESVVSSKREVMAHCQTANKLKKTNMESRGWLFDVLQCVNQTDKEFFDLNDIYKFVEILSKKHEKNNNVHAKIRQQLQYLRNKGIIEFLGKGNYRKI